MNRGSIHWNGVQCSRESWMWQTVMQFYLKPRKWIYCQVIWVAFGMRHSERVCASADILRHSDTDWFRSCWFFMGKMPLIPCLWQEQEGLGPLWSWESLSLIEGSACSSSSASRRVPMLWERLAPWEAGITPCCPPWGWSFTPVRSYPRQNLQVPAKPGDVLSLISLC